MNFYNQFVRLVMLNQNFILVCSKPKMNQWPLQSWNIKLFNCPTGFRIDPQNLKIDC